MILPTPEEVARLARVCADDLAFPKSSEYLNQFAAILRNPAVATLLKLQEGGQGTPLTDALHKECMNYPVHGHIIKMEAHAKHLELCARAIEAATIERCAKEADDWDCSTNPPTVGDLIRAMPSMVKANEPK